MFEIMFNDLKPEAQEEFLKYMGLKDASEGNYEVVPIATVDCNDDEEEEADKVICLAEGNYVEDLDGCLLVNSDIDFGDAETVDVSYEGNPDHYTRYRVLMTKGDFGETILDPTGYEYDEENEDLKMPWEQY
ncbi:MAG: hypothetical protein K6C34_02450 [Alphaproteobacteria bacterium]|nr:hypothetical protein [Alphaproteobacteria bacterium]